MQVMNELREILDRVDVVVRRRRDERHAWLAPPELGDVRRHLLARQLSTLARLGTLSHLDLDLRCLHEELRRDTEASARHLLDGAARAVAILQSLQIRECGAVAIAVNVLHRVEAHDVLAALAAVRHAPNAIHGDRDHLVCFSRDRPKRHAAGAETLHDLNRGLHLLHGDSLAPGVKLHEVAKNDALPVVDVLLEHRVQVVFALTNSLVQQLGHLRVVSVVVEPGTAVQRTVILNFFDGVCRRTLLPKADRLLRELVHGKATNAAHASLE
mmetsp:Transcript_15198/g.40154  ORF Transcript_15198/g.40154 Transcript_15198/m.40154 type:complete len:270 (+) Transcript_15198:1597-2406(+)